jgi:acid stress-induced BolA-like protein IbaG/YrbA
VIARDVETRVAQTIHGSEVAAVGDAQRMEIIVVSDAFEGITRVRKQQMVYAAIAELIAGGALHAVTIRTLTPAERDGAA